MCKVQILILSKESEIINNNEFEEPSGTEEMMKTLDYYVETARDWLEDNGYSEGLLQINLNSVTVKNCRISV